MNDGFLAALGQQAAGSLNGYGQQVALQQAYGTAATNTNIKAWALQTTAGTAATTLMYDYDPCRQALIPREIHAAGPASKDTNMAWLDRRVNEMRVSL